MALPHHPCGAGAPCVVHVCKCSPASGSKSCSVNAAIFLNKFPKPSIYHPYEQVTSHLALTGDVIALPGMIVCDVKSASGSKYYAEE